MGGRVNNSEIPEDMVGGGGDAFWSFLKGGRGGGVKYGSRLWYGVDIF